MKKASSKSVSPSGYDHAKIEKKWQKTWAKKKIFASHEESNKPKYYALDMFPYPSGEGLHVGHPKGYIATDIVSRFKRMNGYSVLHPMGFDAFGLPAENYAIKTKTNPADSVAKNVARYKNQLEILGFDYDWSREVNTTDPNYYRWTQWIFLQLYKKGLAYESNEPINWCPVDKTGLANEDIENGRCERCGSLVEKKPMRQWVLKITDYADRLLKDLDAFDVPCFLQTTEPGKVRPDKPFVERNAVMVIVKHWSQNTYIGLKWKTVDWQTLITGGIEEGQTPEQAGLAEIIEETGYTNVKFIKKVGMVDSKFFHVPKDENCLGHFHILYFELQNGQKNEVSEKEKGIHELVWLSQNEMNSFLSHDSNKYAWSLLQENKVQQPILDWPESIKEAQRNWIGRSEGAQIQFEIDGIQDKKIEVFTTRADTLFGVTYVVLAPEHPFVQELLPVIQNKDEVQAYITKVKNETDIDRSDATKEKTGVVLQGINAINPVNKEKVPVWISDYVLSDYGTGAVMAVPAHDERDWQFAKKFNLPIRQVIDSAPTTIDTKAYTGNGALINSGKFNGQDSHLSKKEIVKYVNGVPKTTYRLRDWVFSRQRYWGEPIPLIHCDRCGVVPVPEKDLPVTLPAVKSYEPTGTGESPLAAIKKWVNVKCPNCEANKNKPKYLIFDFDGVLGDTWDVSLDAYVGIHGVETPEQAAERLRKYFSVKSHHTRDAARTQKQIDDDQYFTKHFGEKMSASNFPLFTKFITEIKKYRNVKCAVVSSGSESYVKPAAKKTGIKFTHVLGFQHHHSKEEKIEHICKDWGVDVKDVYYFTDTKSDIYELENLLDRRKIIGCSWGYQGYDGLAELLPPAQILRQFKDIHRVLDHDCRGRRETNTMPQWAGSSWYYLRYMDPENEKTPVSRKNEKYWSPVDLYVGGAEHATRHLIYARFWHKFLYDIGIVSHIEPFHKLRSVGLIMGEDGRKMSKRFGNVVNPDDIVATYGADTLRVYEMFMGPFDQQIAWNTSSMIGSRRFVERIWSLRAKVAAPGMTSHVSAEANTILNRTIHKTIHKVSDDIEGLRFNTAISSLMIALNEVEAVGALGREHYEILLKLIAPFAPHVAEELWTLQGKMGSIHTSTWPIYDPSLIVENEVTIVLQVNGKVRGSFKAPANSTKEALEAQARDLPEAKKWLENKTISKVIVVPGRLVNIVLTD